LPTRRWQRQRPPVRGWREGGSGDPGPGSSGGGDPGAGTARGDGGGAVAPGARTSGRLERRAGGRHDERAARASSAVSGRRGEELLHRPEVSISGDEDGRGGRAILTMHTATGRAHPPAGGRGGSWWCGSAAFSPNIASPTPSSCRREDDAGTASKWSGERPSGQQRGARMARGVGLARGRRGKGEPNHLPPCLAASSSSLLMVCPLHGAMAGFHRRRPPVREKEMEAEDRASRGHEVDLGSQASASSLLSSRGHRPPSRRSVAPFTSLLWCPV
jgi:hypothetical protein